MGLIQEMDYILNQEAIKKQKLKEYIERIGYSPVRVEKT